MSGKWWSSPESPSEESSSSSIELDRCRDARTSSIDEEDICRAPAGALQISFLIWFSVHSSQASQHTFFCFSNNHFSSLIFFLRSLSILFASSFAASAFSASFLFKFPSTVSSVMQTAMAFKAGLCLLLVLGTGRGKARV